MNARERYRIGGALLTIFALLGLGSCAAAGTAGGGEGDTVVVVENNLIPATSLSVYAVPDAGVRRLVGIVNPSATATLRFNPTATAGQYRLLAETTAGAELVSNPITFSPGATIEWDVSANIARVVNPG